MPNTSEREEFRRLASDEIERGKLFLLSTQRCWAGPATGLVCVVCSREIHEGHEYEIEGPQGAAAAHVACQSVWREVSANLTATSTPASTS